MKTLTSEEVESRIDKHGPVLAHYVNMAELMADMFSPLLETVVHDLSNPESSIIAIFNGELTGRDIGDPATDVVKKLLDGELPDMISNYENEAPNGQKLKSASLAIRDKKGNLVGVMGVNMNISYFDKYSKLIEQFIFSQEMESIPESEDFRSMTPNNVKSPRQEIKDAIDSYCISTNKNPMVMDYDDKREIVEYLYKNGYFKNRGVVKIISDLLNITRPSVYKYKDEFIERQNNN